MSDAIRPNDEPPDPRRAPDDDTTTDWTPSAPASSGSGSDQAAPDVPAASGTDWTRPIAGWAPAAAPGSPQDATPPATGSSPAADGTGRWRGSGSWRGSRPGPTPPAAGFGAAPGSGLSRDAAMPRTPGMDPLPPPSDAWRDRSRGREGPGSGPIVFGLLLILGGGFLLARELLPELRVNLIWPMVVICLGVLLVLLAFLRPPRGDRR